MLDLEALRTLFPERPTQLPRAAESWGRAKLQEVAFRPASSTRCDQELNRCEPALHRREHGNGSPAGGDLERLAGPDAPEIYAEVLPHRTHTQTLEALHVHIVAHAPERPRL
jgi:hypothetical protein